MFLQANIKYGSDLFFRSNDFCQQKWRYINKLIALLTLKRYCTDDDVKILKIPTMENMIKYFVFNMIASEMKIQFKERTVRIELQKNTMYTRSSTQPTAKMPPLNKKYTLEERQISSLLGMSQSIAKRRAKELF